MPAPTDVKAIHELTELVGSVVDGDFIHMNDISDTNASRKITKKNFVTNIVDADIAAGAAVAYAKLDLAGSIVNNDLLTGTFAAIRGLGVQTQALDMGDNTITMGGTDADILEVGHIERFTSLGSVAGSGFIRMENGGNQILARDFNNTVDFGLRWISVGSNDGQVRLESCDFNVQGNDIINTGTLTLPTATGTILSTGQTWTMGDGIKAIFNPDATNSGINVGSHAGQPSTPADGDIIYNSTANEMQGRVNGAWVDLGGAGGGATDSISEGDSNVEVIDAGTGQIDFDIDAALFARMDAASGFDLQSNNMTGVSNIQVDDPNVASAGRLRLGQSENISWRNQGNTNDISVGTNILDQIIFTINGGFEFSVSATQIDANNNALVNVAGATLDSGTKLNVNSDATEAAFRDAGHTADPSSPAAGDFYYNTTSNQYKYYNGSIWQAFAAGGGISNVVEDTTPQLGGQLDVNGFAIGNGTEELITFTETVSAVNQIHVTNAATGNGATLSVEGETNVDLILDGKGTGDVVISSSDLNISGNSILNTGTLTLPTATGTLLSTAESWTMVGGIKANFRQSATTAGMNLGTISAAPSTPAQGDMWYQGVDDNLVFEDAAGSRVVASLDNTETFTNHTIDETNNSIKITKYKEAILFDFTTDITTGDGKFYSHIPPEFDGFNLVYVHAEVITSGTTGTTDIQIHNVDNALDMLSTKLTIDTGETGSDTAAAAAVINTSNDHVNTNDVLRLDVDAVSTTAPKGLIVTMGFKLP